MSVIYKNGTYYGAGGGGEGADTEIISDDFDPTESYDVGAYVVYEGILYKCTTAHTGAWDAADFDDTNVMDEMPTPMPSTDMSEVVTPLPKVAARPGFTATPDWDNKVVIDNPVSYFSGQINYTCPANGQLFISDAASTGGSVVAYIKINDNKVGSGVNSYATFVNAIVGKDDVVTSTGLANRAPCQMIFVPWKTV